MASTSVIHRLETLYSAVKFSGRSAYPKSLSHWFKNAYHGLWSDWLNPVLVAGRAAQLVV